MAFNEKFINKMQDLLGDDSPRFFDALEKPPVKAVTINTLKIDDEIFNKIADFKHTKVLEVSNGYYVDGLKVGTHTLNHLGVIYSQEPSAMYPIEMLDINEGDIVLDLCSAPGGKSIQILEKLNGTGLLVSNEIVYNRAKILYENLNRMGFKNFAITCNSPQDFENTNLKFNKILVDAPCGGEGMFRRDNFDFNSYDKASIETNAKRQISILESIKNLLTPGGKLVYSTCTYDIQENECIIAEFLKNNPDYSIMKYDRLNSVTTDGIKIENYNTHYCKRRYPHLFDGEGQFMALLVKAGNEDVYIPNDFSAKGFSDVYKKDIEILRKAFKDVADISTLNLVKRNNNIYILPSTTIDFENLNLVSIGCLLGTINSGDIKIAHEFYHTYGELFKNKVELDKTKVLEYLKGYEINIENQPNGICVLTHLGINLGGGKVVGDKIKNYYPKNLRNN